MILKITAHFTGAQEFFPVDLNKKFDACYTHVCIMHSVIQHFTGFAPVAIGLKST